MYLNWIPTYCEKIFFKTKLVDIVFTTESKMLRNKHLKLQAQQMAMNVLNYFARERDNGGAFIPFTSVMQCTAEACGISINTLTTIRKRFNEAEIENQPVQCSSKRPRCKPKSVNVNNYIKDFVKRKIYEMHTNHRHVTVGSLRQEILETSQYNINNVAYNQECDNFMRTKNYEAITQSYIAMLFNKAYYRVATIEKAASRFEKTGIFPLRPEVIAEEEFAPTEELAVHVVDEDNETGENGDRLNEGKSEEVPIAGPSGYTKKKDETADIEDTDDEDKSLMMEEQHISINKKGHSLIFTSIPNKDLLVEKTHKKDKRQVVKVDKAKRNLCEREILQPLKKQKGKDGKSKKVEEMCIVCEDVGKDREWWLKCALCDMWPHLECTELSHKDVCICHNYI
ncbi:hypothetical protein FQA39_LY08671 [Lamprigera yunnana]|nr:hypothetical protein FQA39_LY08671 [Lamprigera yunnana]